MDEIELLGRLVVLVEYQLGMLAFGCGILLFAVFAYGMNLR